MSSFHFPLFTTKSRRSSTTSGYSASSTGQGPVQILSGSAIDGNKLKDTLRRKNRGGYRLEVLFSFLHPWQYVATSLLV